MYKQVIDPVGNSLVASSLFALLPLVTLFVLLGGFKVKAWISGVAALARDRGLAGSVVAPVRVAPGEEITAELGPLGRLTVRLTA